MRTNNEIVLAVQEGEEVSVEELKLALLCYSHTAHRMWREAYKFGEMNPEDIGAGELLRHGMMCKSEAKSYWLMSKTDPNTYLGPRHTPGTPENDEGRKLSKAILKKVEDDQRKRR